MKLCLIFTIVDLGKVAHINKGVKNIEQEKRRKKKP